MNKLKLLIFPILLILFSCSGVKVKQDYDTTFNFSVLKNFTWREIDKTSTKCNTLLEERMHMVVNEELKAKGFILTEKDQADFLLDYHYSLREILAVDIIYKTNEKLIWRGVASEKLLNSRPEKTTENFRKVVHAILKKFPPTE